MFGKRGEIVKSSSKSNVFNSILSLKNSNNKRGQVTVFIILGIILLLLVILLILLRQEMAAFFGLEEVVISQQGAVESYVTDCIAEVGDEALLIAGLQGGYIEMPERYTDDIGWHLELSPFLYVPLWANGPEIDQPSLEEIKIQVDEYIEENVQDCLFREGAFSETYDIVEISSVESDVNFFDSRTVFNVHWDLLVQDKMGEVVAELINHEAQSDIRFKTLYEMANSVLIAEMAQLKLEDITQDLIALEHEDVPVAGIEISCSEKRWEVDQAEETLKDMLRINLRNLKLEGTDFVEFPEELPYYENHYVWDVENYDKDISAVFKFENTYPFTFQVTPQKGNYMTSDRLGGGSVLSFLCIQNWKFTYDVVYPVIVEIRDEESGAIFQMAFTVNLIKNYPYKGPVIARESQFSDTVTDDDYCYRSPSYVSMDVETYSLIQNNDTGVYSQEPLEDVDVSYTCIKYRCEMGTSEYDFEQRGDVAGLSAEFPYCSAAIMRGAKEGYIETWEYVVPEEDDIVQLNLRPLLTFTLADVEIVKHQLVGRECESEEVEESETSEENLCFDISDGEVIGAEEIAMVTMKHYPGAGAFEEVEAETNETEETSTEESTSYVELGEFLLEGSELHKAEFIVSPGLDEEYIAESEVQLLAGADFEYDVLIYLVDEEDLIGGYRGKWLVPWSSLEQEGTKVRFHVLEVDPTEEEDYYGFMANMEDFSEELPEPELI